MLIIHIICGVACIVIMTKSINIPNSFDVFDIFMFTLLGPLLLLSYSFCIFYTWVDKLKNKKHERTTKI